MSDLKISEAGTVQFPMVKHAAEIGWTPLAPEVAKQKRGGEAGMLLRDELEEKLSEFNPWLEEQLPVDFIVDLFLIAKVQLRERLHRMDSW